MGLAEKSEGLMAMVRGAYTVGRELPYHSFEMAGLEGERRIPDIAIPIVKGQLERVKSTEWYQRLGLLARLALTLGVDDGLAPYGIDSRLLYNNYITNNKKNQIK